MTEITTISAAALTRRSLISLTGVGAGALALAACSTSSGGSGSSAGTDSEAATLPAGTEVAKLSDIPVGGVAAAVVDKVPLLFAQPSAGTVVCFSAICTHQGCVVDAAATEFDCACHGSKFAADGAVLAGPAVRDLDPIKVTISGDLVVTA